MTALCRSITIVLFGITIGLAQSVTAQTIVLDGNGTGLGTLVNPYPSGSPQGALQVPFESTLSMQTSRYWIINEKSYQFSLDWPVLNYETSEALPNAALGSHGNSPLYYESQDCTGQAFVGTRQSGIVFSIANWRGVTDAEQNQAVYYVPINEELRKQTFFSRYLSYTDECESLSGTTYNFSGRAYPNDPAETGFTDPTPPMPIQLRSALDPELARCIFRDGFECEA